MNVAELAALDAALVRFRDEHRHDDLQFRAIFRVRTEIEAVAAVASCRLFDVEEVAP